MTVSKIDELLSRGKVKKGKAVTSLVIKPAPMDIADVKLEFQKEVRRGSGKVIELTECSPHCPSFNSGVDCTPDKCPPLNKKLGNIAISVLDNNAKVVDPNRRRRVFHMSSFERSQMYEGINWIQKVGEFDQPLYDTIVGDRKIWTVPTKVDGKLVVSHRVTIYGLRCGVRKQITTVELYVKGWETTHENCDLHKKEKVWKNAHRCFEHSVNARPVIYINCPNCGKQMDRRLEECPKCKKHLSWKLKHSLPFVGKWICPRCFEERPNLARVWNWKYECEACNVDDDAKEDAFEWLIHDKLVKCGVNYRKLPYEKYLFLVQRLTSKRSRIKGMEWR